MWTSASSLEPRPVASSHDRTAVVDVSRMTPPVAGFIPAAGSLRFRDATKSDRRRNNSQRGGVLPLRAVWCTVARPRMPFSLTGVRSCSMFSRRDMMVGAGLAAAFGLDIAPRHRSGLRPEDAGPGQGLLTPTRSARPRSPPSTTASGRSRTIPPSSTMPRSTTSRRRMVKAGLPAEFVSIPFTVSVVKSGGKAHHGATPAPAARCSRPPANSSPNMKAAGIDPAKIDTILISHSIPTTSSG